MGQRALLSMRNYILQDEASGSALVIGARN